MSKSLESVSQIASDFCADIGDSTERHHLRYQSKLLKAFKKLNLYVSPCTEVEGQIFPVNGEVQFELPCNFVYETKVGLLKNNILVTLDLKRDLRLTNKKSTDTQIQTDLNCFWDGSLSPAEFYPFYNLQRCGNYVGEMYGFGCGYHSHQWYNIKDGVLEIGSMIPDDVEIVIEYKSNGLSKEGFKLVPTEIVPYLEKEANKEWYEHSNPSLSADFERKAKEEYYRVKRLYNYRDPEYLAWLFKSEDRAMRL